MKPLPKARLALMVALVAWMFGGPFARQVLLEHHWSWPRWVMMSGHGIQVCDVRFEQDGQRLDRCQVLGHPDCWSAPMKVRRLGNKREVNAQAARICAVKRQDPSLTMTARCGSSAGWRTVYENEPMCE